MQRSSYVLNYNFERLVDFVGSLFQNQVMVMLLPGMMTVKLGNFDRRSVAISISRSRMCMAVVTTRQRTFTVVHSTHPSCVCITWDLSGHRHDELSEKEDIHIRSQNSEITTTETQKIHSSSPDPGVRDIYGKR
jgi:hypothetical protein